jgi:Domain of unknown function (DUF4157)
MTSSPGPIQPHHAGTASRVIQGFFPGGRPRIVQAFPAPVGPFRRQVSPPVPARPDAPPTPVVPGRPATDALQPALRPCQPPRPILPTRVQPGAVQPATPLRPQAPQPIVPQRATPLAVQPHKENAFPLPGNFTLKSRGSGQPLPEPIQKKMESFFNTSFADVRVHVGHEAPSIGALAFTHGTDLYFAPGQYNPQSTQGQQLLGHELSHVVQQRAGRVRNPLGLGIAVVQDPTLEAEAERMGLRAATIQNPIQARRTTTGPILEAAGKLGSSKASGSLGPVAIRPGRSLRQADRATGPTHDPIRPTRAAGAPVQRSTRGHVGSSRAIQRLVALASDVGELDDEDVALYHMIDYAFKKAGGPIVDFTNNPDFSRLGLNETFYIMEHGQKGLIERSKMSNLIERLTAEGTGLPPDFRGTIILTACWGAVPDTAKKVDSAIAQLAAGLKDKRPGVKIVGAKGPTMIASHFDAGIEVFNPETQYHSSYQQVVVEAGFREKKKEWLRWLKENPQLTLDVKAAKCVEIFRDVQTIARKAMAKKGFLFTEEAGRTVSVFS